MRDRWRWLLLLSAGATLAACAGAKPMEVPQSGEIPPGPGLFSGKDGVFTIYRNRHEPEPAAKAEANAEAEAKTEAESDAKE